MATHTDTPPDGDTAAKKDEGKQDGKDTFETDVSKTDSEETTVRQAEVRSDDLSKTNPPDSE